MRKIAMPNPRPAAEERPDRNCFTLPDGSCIGRNCMHDVKPTTAAKIGRVRPVECPYCGNKVIVLKDHKEECVIWDVIA